RAEAHHVRRRRRPERRRRRAPVRLGPLPGRPRRRQRPGARPARAHAPGPAPNRARLRPCPARLGGGGQSSGGVSLSFRPSAHSSLPPLGGGIEGGSQVNTYATKNPLQLPLGKGESSVIRPSHHSSFPPLGGGIEGGSQVNTYATKNPLQLPLGKG